MRICFIRHAEDKERKDNGTFEDTKLTTFGKKILRQTIKYYDDENIAAVYSSPNIRAIKSAEIIAKRYNVPLIVEENLRERKKFNYVVGSDDEKEFWDNYLNYSYKTDKFETCKEFIDRNFEVFDKIKKAHNDLNQNVIIVGHSATLYALNTYFNGIPKDNQIVWMQCGNCCMVKFETQNNIMY